MDKVKNLLTNLNLFDDSHTQIQYKVRLRAA